MTSDAAQISGVENVFHALALHERRSRFQPVMAKVSHQAWQNLEQCWFCGYHGDIGGGRPDDLLAHSPLAWMMAKLLDHVEFDFNGFWNDEVNAKNINVDFETTGKLVPS